MADFNPANYESNPLQKYFRQPKIYITLPSKGNFYPESAIEMPENGELPIYAMTAKDELSMKTPDALLNGQATVDLIQSCVPNIKDAWQLPNIDLDAVLIAIRIATYGEMMDITTKVPKLGDERTFQVDLRQILNKLVVADFDNFIQVSEMKINLRPITYKEMTEAGLKTFEEQRIFNIVNNDDIPDSEKLARFNESFKKLTQLTVHTISKSIAKIEVGDTSVTNQKHIDEFIDNADKEFYTYLTEHLESQKDKFSVQPLEVDSPQEDIDRGAPANWSVPITFDQSNFFG